MVPVAPPRIWELLGVTRAGKEVKNRREQQVGQDAEEEKEPATLASPAQFLETAY